MRGVFRELAAIGAAAASLGAFMGLAGFAWPVAFGLSAAVYLGARRVLPRPPEKRLEGGFTRSEVDEAKREIRSQANRFDHFGDRLKGDLRKRVRHIAQTLREMDGHLKRDPSNLALAHEFLELHVPKALRIVERFTVLSEQPYLDDDARAGLDAAEETLVKIEKAFEAQHGRMLESDVQEFEIDRRVFEALLSLDEPRDAFDKPGDAVAERPQETR